MPVSAEALRSHLDYTAWASQRLLKAGTELSEEQLTQDFKTADRSVLGSLTHLARSDYAWLRRVNGQPNPQFPAETSLAALQADWPVTQQGWKEWSQGLTDEIAQTEIVYQDFKGRTWKQPAWQIVLHLVNHGTHHRGQVSGFLRAMGRVPPPLDLIHYYRGLP